MKHRIEMAIYNFFQIQKLRQQIKDLEQENDNLLLVSEAKNPDSVKGVDLGILAGFHISVKETSHVGHVAEMGNIKVYIHTLKQSGTLRVDPRDYIFAAVFKEMKNA